MKIIIMKIIIKNKSNCNNKFNNNNNNKFNNYLLRINKINIKIRVII